MEKNEGIEIRQVSNGFIVYKVVSIHEVTPITEAKVFQSLIELMLFLKKHFEHRGADIASDSPTTNKTQETHNNDD